MKRRFIVAFGCLSCWCGFSALSPPPVASAPPQADAAFNSALEDGGNKLAADDTQGAIRSLQAALRAEPDNAEAAHLLTVAYLQSGQLTQALATAETEVNKPTAKTDERARAALMEGTASYGLFTERLKSVNGQMSSFASMKLLLEQMAPHSRMLPSGDTIVDPGDDGLQSTGAALNSSLKATIDDLQKTLSQSEQAFRLALSIDPHLPGAHDGLGLVRAAQGYSGESRLEFLAEIAQNGASGTAYLHLAEADLLQHQDEEAIENLRLAAALSPDLEAPYRDLTTVYESQKDNDRVQWAKGMCALKHGDLRGAEAAFSKSFLKTSDLLCSKAQLALEQKRPQDARTLLAQARALDLRNAEILTRLGDLEASENRSQQAIDCYHQALDIDPVCGAAWYGIGLAYDALKDRESAVADFREALQFNPNDPSIRLHLANDEAELGQIANSAADFSDYLRRFPTASNRYVVLAAITQNQPH